MKTAIVNGRVILPTEVINDGCVVVCNGTITDCYGGRLKDEAENIVDAKGSYISPGFIDIHVHGGGGYDFMDGTAEAFLGAGKAHMIHGTTSLLPTTLTCSDEELSNTFSAYQEAKARNENGPHLLGLHLEGPYFSPKQVGAQDPVFLRLPETDHYTRILDASSDILRVSVAPELPGALELGDELKRRGIIASIGHSDAGFDDMAAACKHGYVHVTHLYSGMSSLHREGPYRRLGVVECAYLFDELSVELIGDGIHLPPELLKMIIKCKDKDKVCLITDAMRGATLSDGSIVKLGSLKNGQDTRIENGVAMHMNGKCFAGSVCTMDRCAHTMHVDCGLPIVDVINMMTYNPARIINAGTKGRLLPGMDADICIFDDNITIQGVFVSGKHVFSAT